MTISTTPKDYFDNFGYVILKDAMPKELCKQLTDHMFKLHDEGKLVKDEQCPLSDSVYGDPIFDDLLQKYAKPLGDHIGKTLLPTYTYARIYRTGEVLKKHKDRPACEISATMTLGFDGIKVWPIFFDEKKEIPVDLNVGELAMYKGCEILHWRPQFKGKWQVQVFFHYVDANGPYKNEYKDGRSQFGVDKTKPGTVDPNNLTFPLPMFNSVIIPHHDEKFPDYFCINKENFKDLVFTAEECEKILQISKEDYAISASIGGGNSGAIERRIRSAKIYNVDNTENNRWIFEKMAVIVSLANKYHFDYDISGITHSLQLVEYSAEEEVSGHYDWHTDSGPGPSAMRKISVTVQLSDPNDYKGCELLINNHGTIVEGTKERGSVHMFPSYMVHKVNPITEGTRYALVIWIHGSRRFR
jgi:PKHD-type hydroxylase